jgi:hypothetical protein
VKIEENSMAKWGFLRETVAMAEKAGVDKDTGLHRTGLKEYLKVIFPEVNDWMHDKALGNINGDVYKSRPDYRSIVGRIRRSNRLRFEFITFGWARRNPPNENLHPCGGLRHAQKEMAYLMLVILRGFYALG